MVSRVKKRRTGKNVFKVNIIFAIMVKQNVFLVGERCEKIPSIFMQIRI